jgi:hypothetical protein
MDRWGETEASRERSEMGGGRGETELWVARFCRRCESRGARFLYSTSEGQDDRTG